MTHGARYQFFGVNYQASGSWADYLKSIAEALTSVQKGRCVFNTVTFSALHEQAMPVMRRYVTRQLDVINKETRALLNPLMEISSPARRQREGARSGVPVIGAAGDRDQLRVPDSAPTQWSAWKIRRSNELLQCSRDPPARATRQKPRAIMVETSTHSCQGCESLVRYGETRPRYERGRCLFPPIATNEHAFPTVSIGSSTTRIRLYPHRAANGA
jgi:hypothetical protein